MGDIIIFQHRTSKSINVKHCQDQIMDIKEHLLFIHAWSGCDTTSAIFGKGKAFAVKKLRNSVQLQECSAVISSVVSTAEAVKQASVMAFQVFYSASSATPLEKIRSVNDVMKM